MDDGVDPYVPPASNVEPASGARPIVRAGRWRRFGTWVLDQLGIFLLAFIVSLVVILAFGPAGTVALKDLPSFLLGAVFGCCYYLLFEGVWARTPAKLILGTVVVDEQGLRPRFGQIVGRTLCRFIPFEALSFFGARGWHDRIPRTHVVLTRPPEAAVEIARTLGAYPPPDDRVAQAQ